MRKHALSITAFIILIFLAGCADQIVSECDDPIEPAGTPKLNTFSGIQEKLFTPTCATSGCHGNNATQANLLLATGNAYSNLVNVQGSVYSQFERVVPGDSENSLLIKVLRGDGVGQMPPTGKLDDAVIDSVAMWIDNGALNN